MSQSRIEKGLYQAQKLGYSACSYCDGIPYDTTLVEHREYYEATSCTNAILYSLIWSVIGMIAKYCNIFWLRNQCSKYEWSQKVAPFTYWTCF